MKRLIACLLAMSMIAAACGGGDSADEGETTTTAAGSETPAEMTTVNLQLQWFAQSQFAGYYAAKALGYYSDEGLDVNILEGAVDIVPQQVVATGGAEFGLAWVPKALVSHEEGAGLVN
ncbi:MAG: ABC transporter substrate-binding protein, partial [Acidimicrobiia bacterium]|nr:ABC transporter substrate-binding protein [Acidimicrobiia bacterium]